MKYKKKELLEMVASLEEVNNTIIHNQELDISVRINTLADCQELAISIGNYVEVVLGEGTDIVHGLEEYCETIYQMSQHIEDERTCKQLAIVICKQLLQIREKIQNDLPEAKKEVVFLPYKASMWDSLESVWKEAVEDETCETYVIPIPYYDKNADRSLGQMHYEGDDYPDYVPITRYEDYNFAEHCPDEIYVHNPYDEYNRVTSVHPFFYSKNLKKYTKKLVYIPYFVLREIDPQDESAVQKIEHFISLPGVIHADKVMVQSEDMRRIYINVLANLYGERNVKIAELENKIMVKASPKLEKLLTEKNQDYNIPEEWSRIITKVDGTRKKVILYNTSITAMLQKDEQMVVKLKDVLSVFKAKQEEIALLWRPHPLIEATIKSMRPSLWESYQKIVNQYRSEGWGIYDDTPELDRALIMSDAYYGDGSSLLIMYQKLGKPIMVQNADVILKSGEK